MFLKLSEAVLLAVRTTDFLGYAYTKETDLFIKATLFLIELK